MSAPAENFVIYIGGVDTPLETQILSKTLGTFTDTLLAFEEIFEASGITPSEKELQFVAINTDRLAGAGEEALLFGWVYPGEDMGLRKLRLLGNR